MVGGTDNKDKNEARRIALALLSLLLVVAIAAAFMLPGVADIAATHLAPGLGLKDAAVIAFVVTMIIMVVFAIASGDGLLGEIQFILIAFFFFFIIIWLMLAWVF